MIEETKKFKEILDKLPYISEGEKAIACSLFIVSDENKRQEMLKFYENQTIKHQEYVKEYQNKLNAAKVVLKQELFD